MALLHDPEQQADVPLPGRVLIGRAPTATLRLSDKRVSGEHASLVWLGDEWVLRDLGSRNGTYLDGRRIEAGAPVPLVEGAAVSFGGLEPRYVLVDSAPPGPVARDLDAGTLRAANRGLLLLPDDAEPEVVLFEDGQGAWALEVADERRPAHDGLIVRAGGRPWQLLMPEEVDGTATIDVGPSIDTLSMRFAVSRDEEHVQVWYRHRGRDVELDRREHLYLLLLLARRRLEDRGLPDPDQGWIDRDVLLGWLKLDANGLNVAIHRARGHLAARGIQGAAGIVEVRRGQRRLGLDPDRIALD